MVSMRKLKIKKICVKQLFGMYDYDLPEKETKKNIEKMFIVYGDNGSGKTTILKLIFHLLSSEIRGGHKTFVAQTKFRRIEITFSNGYRVWAERKENIIGSFLMGIEFSKKDKFKFELIANQDNIIEANTSNKKYDKQSDEFLKILSRLNISLYLLSDDRKVRFSAKKFIHRAPIEKEIEEDDDLIIDKNILRHKPLFEEDVDPEKIAVELLKQSIRRAISWIRSKVMSASTRGDSNVNTLYSQIINSIAIHKKKTRIDKPIVKKRIIIQKTFEIEKRNKEYSKFGLMPVFNASKIISTVKRASKENFELINRILDPYLESVNAKLNALKDIKTIIEKLVTIINSFFVDKKMSFHTSQGLEVQSAKNEKLSPEMLSSGERHLLLLFCNAITSVDNPTIFIIDEPEISLNIKWQRELVDSLLDLVGKNPVQYIFATHSLEILGKHLDKVVKLTNAV